MLSVSIPVGQGKIMNLFIDDLEVIMNTIAHHFNDDQ